MPKRIDAPQAERMMERGALFIDVLPATIFVQERLPGAISVPLETLDATAVADLDRDRPIVLYCFDQH